MNAFANSILRKGGDALRNSRQKFELQDSIRIISPQDDIPVFRQGGDDPATFLLEITA
jgi:hypothetical protein